jgi:alpha-ketoglutarate-dependent taurine dioxygenase
LPRHAFYGDGSAIEEEALEQIRKAYRDARLLIEWERGDVLLLDNLFYAHGRLAFTGERKIIVAMDTRGGVDTSPV